MSDVKWIKIVTDIFDDEKILLIEQLPDADSVIVIWFKLLCLAGKQNNGGVFVLNNRVPYTLQMLSTIFRRKESIVTLALKTFEEFGMIEIIDCVITIPNWEKIQNISGLDSIREKARLRQAKYREKQLLLLNTKDKEEEIKNKNKNKEGNVTRNVTNDVTYFEDSNLNSTFISWLEYKKEKRQAYKPKGLEALVTQTKNNVDKYGVDSVINAIQQSMSCNYQGIIWNYARNGSKPFAKTVKQSPEWLKNYENVDEPKKEELTPEEAKKVMEKLKAKYETKIPEALKERS